MADDDPQFEAALEDLHNYLATLYKLSRGAGATPATAQAVQIATRSLLPAGTRVPVPAGGEILVSHAMTAPDALIALEAYAESKDWTTATLKAALDRLKLGFKVGEWLIATPAVAINLLRVLFSDDTTVKVPAGSGYTYTDSAGAAVTRPALPGGHLILGAALEAHTRSLTARNPTDADKADVASKVMQACEALVTSIAGIDASAMSPNEKATLESKLTTAYLYTMEGAPVLAQMYKALPRPKYLKVSQAATRDHMVADLDGLLKFGLSSLPEAADIGGYPLAVVNASLKISEYLRVTTLEVFSQGVYSGTGSQTHQLHRDILRAFLLLCSKVNLRDYSLLREASGEQELHDEDTGITEVRQEYTIRAATPAESIHTVFGEAWTNYLKVARPSSVALGDATTDTGFSLDEVRAQMQAMADRVELEERSVPDADYIAAKRIRVARVALGGPTLDICDRLRTDADVSKIMRAGRVRGDINNPVLTAAEILHVVDIDHLPVIALTTPADVEVTQGDMMAPTYARYLWGADLMEAEEHALANKALACVKVGMERGAASRSTDCPVTREDASTQLESLLDTVNPRILSIGGWRYVVAMTAVASYLASASAAGEDIPYPAIQAFVLHLGLLNNLPLQARAFDAGIVEEAAFSSPAAAFLRDDLAPHLRAALDAAMNTFVAAGAGFTIEDDEADGDVDDDEDEDDDEEDEEAKRVRGHARILTAIPRWNIADLYHLPVMMIVEAMLATGQGMERAAGAPTLELQLRALFPSAGEWEAEQEGLDAAGLRPSPTATSMTAAMRWLNGVIEGGAPDLLKLPIATEAPAEENDHSAFLARLGEAHAASSEAIIAKAATGTSAFPRSRLVDRMMGRTEPAVESKSDANPALFPNAVLVEDVRSYPGAIQAVGYLDLPPYIIARMEISQAEQARTAYVSRNIERDVARRKNKDDVRRDRIAASLVGKRERIVIKAGDDARDVMKGGAGSSAAGKTEAAKKAVNRVRKLETDIRGLKIGYGNRAFSDITAYDELRKPEYGSCYSSALPDDEAKQAARNVDLEVSSFRAQCQYEKWKMVAENLRGLRASATLDAPAIERRAEQEERVAGEAFQLIEKLLADFWPSLYATFGNPDRVLYDAGMIRSPVEDVLPKDRDGLNKCKHLRTQLLDLSCAPGIVECLSHGITIAAAEQGFRSGFATFDAVAEPRVVRSPDLTYVRWQLHTLGAYMPRPVGTPDDRVAYPVDDWQRRVLDQVDTFDAEDNADRKSTFLLAPTSSGKTFLAVDYPIAKVVSKDNDGILIFVVPTRALVEQVIADIDARFTKTGARDEKFYSQVTPDFYDGNTVKMRVIRVNSDGSRVTEATDTGRKEMVCQVVVTIPESLDVLISNAYITGWVDRVRYLVLDEVHNFISEYGAVWERIMTRLPCPMMAMSATVGGPEHMYEWMQRVEASRGRVMPERIVQYARYNDLAMSVWRPSIPGLTKAGLEAISPVAALKWASISPLSATDAPIDILPEHTLPLQATAEQVLTARLRADPGNADLKALLDRAKKVRPDVFFRDHYERRITITESRAYAAELIKLLKAIAAKDESAALDVIARIRAPVDTALETVDEQIAELGPRQWLIENMEALVGSLRDSRLLPALIFHLNQRGVDFFAVTLAKQLEDREREYRTTAAHLRDVGKAQERLEMKRRRRDELEEIIERLEAKASVRSRDQASKKMELDENRKEKAGVLQEVKELERKLRDLTDESIPLPKFCYSMPGKDPISEHDVAEALFMDLEKYKEAEADGGFQGRRFRALRRGIAVHHPRVSQKYRLAVEILFRERRIMVLFATQGMAQGINAPCRSVVVAGDSLKLDAVTFRQMAGRAGRRGHDDRGDVLFYGVAPSRVMQLVAAGMPNITPHWLLNTTTTARGIARNRALQAAAAGHKADPCFRAALDNERDEAAGGLTRIATTSLLASLEDGGDNLVEAEGGIGVGRLQQTAVAMQFELLRSLRMVSPIGGPSGYLGLLAHLDTEESGAAAGLTSLLASGALITVIRDVLAANNGGGAGSGSLTIPWTHGGPVPTGGKRPNLSIWLTTTESERAIDSAILHALLFLFDRVPLRGSDLETNEEPAIRDLLDHGFDVNDLHPRVKDIFTKHNAAVNAIVLHYHSLAALEAGKAASALASSLDGFPKADGAAPFRPSTRKSAGGVNLRARGVDVSMEENEDQPETGVPTLPLPNAGGLYGAVAGLSSLTTIRDPFEATAEPSETFASLDAFARSARPDMHVDASAWPEIRRLDAPRNRYLAYYFATGVRDIMAAYFRVDDEEAYERASRVMNTIRLIALAFTKAFLSSTGVMNDFAWASFDEVEAETRLGNVPTPAPQSDEHYDLLLVKSLLRLSKKFRSMYQMGYGK